QVPPAVMTQRVISHDRTQIRAAEPDVDDVADALAGIAAPLAVADLVGKGSHPIEHRVHFGNDVDAVDDDPFALRRPQGDVKNGAFFRDVDPVAREHGRDARLQAARLGEIHQQPDRLLADSVLRVVEINPGAFGGEAFAAPRVVGKELPQMPVLQCSPMHRQRFPRRAIGQRLGLRLRSGAHRRLRYTRATFSSASLLSAIQSSNSFQDLSNACAPSRWSFAASAASSTPTAANSAITCSASPPSLGSTPLTRPWSAKASSVLSGMVLIVLGAPAAATWSVSDASASLVPVLAQSRRCGWAPAAASLRQAGEASSSRYAL